MSWKYPPGCRGETAGALEIQLPWPETAGVPANAKGSRRGMGGANQTETAGIIHARVDVCWGQLQTSFTLVGLISHKQSTMSASRGRPSSELHCYFKTTGIPAYHTCPQLVACVSFFYHCPLVSFIWITTYLVLLSSADTSNVDYWLLLFAVDLGFGICQKRKWKVRQFVQ